jgi:glycosidase
VYRPRALPLLTEVKTAQGTKHVWTTFSTDQIDLNFRNPDVLLEIIDILLLYVQQGARLLRLDAIGFLWKQPGTNCFHLPQTHAAVKLIRQVMDQVCPEVMLVPEINGTLEENLGYFGDGNDEAQMVYNFALAPLTLDAFARGDGSVLSGWLRTLPAPSLHTTLFNFLASHDGIGVRAASGILSDNQMQALVSRTEACGGRVNFRYDATGAKVPYELATTLYDVLSAGSDSEATNVARFVCAHGIMCAIAGVPGIYFHSFLGTSNWQEGFAQTEHARTLNRRKFSWQELQSLLSAPQSRAAQVHSRMTCLLRARAAEPAFHPSATQRILEMPKQIVAIQRSRSDGSATVVALHNVADVPITCQLPDTSGTGHEILTNASIDCSKPITLDPYDIKWIRLQI